MERLQCNFKNQGPSGFYIGVKPDRTLQKEKIFRRLQERFPHLSLYPHPAYHKPWLSPKNPPSSYAQAPFFSPGLQFPYILLKGYASKRARHIHHPLGIFQLRPWRFEPPLFNLGLTRRMRQGRFRNVFHQQQTRGKTWKPGSVVKKRVADSVGYVGASTQFKTHFWSDAGLESKHQLIAKVNHKLFLLDDTEAKVEPGSVKEDVESDVGDAKEGKKGGRNALASTAFSSESKKSTKSKAKTTKTGVSKTPKHNVQPSKGFTKTTGKEKYNISQSDSEWETRLHTSDHESSSNNRNSQAKRDALEIIARREKRERKLKKEQQRTFEEKQRAEQDYLKNLLNKSLKKYRKNSGPHLKRTRSQRRRALYRKYLEKKELTPEEEMALSQREEWLKHRAVLKKYKKKVSMKHPKTFPYGNMPSRFQKTPTSRFFWGEDGPELRNKQNRDKFNVFRRHHEKILMGVQDIGTQSETVVNQDGLAPSTKDARFVPSLIRPVTESEKPLLKNRLVPIVYLGTKLLEASGATVTESRSSSPFNQLNQRNQQQLSVKQTAKSNSNLLQMNFGRPNEASSKTNDFIRNENLTEKDQSDQHRKQKAKLHYPSVLELVLQEGERKIPAKKHPETYLKVREELIELRQKAWCLSLQRQARKQEKRQARNGEDRTAREAEIQKINYPIVEKPEQKIASSHLSVSAVKVDVANVISHQSRDTQPAYLGHNPVPQHIRIFPKAKNHREAFRAYTAIHLLRLKAGLIFKHRLGHANKKPRFDRWGRPVKTTTPLFDNKNPYLVKIIKNFMRTKTGFRYKYDTKAEEFLINFPFVEFQTYQKFPVTRMTRHDRIKHYIKLKKMYRGQRIFKLMTPLRSYKSVKKNTLETPFDRQLYSDAVGKLHRLSKNQNERDKETDNPGETYHHFGLYEVICDHLKIPPFKEFQNQLARVTAGKTSSIQLANQNLTDTQIRPISLCVMLSKLVNQLDISGNLLGSAGGMYVAGICGHTGQLSELNISNQQLDSAAAEIFFQCLRKPSCKMKRIWLSNCGFGPECVQFIAGVIMENRSLTLLDLSKNKLASVGNIDMFGLAIAENSFIQELNLAYNGFGEKASFLIFIGATANSSIEIFNFAHNHVGEEGCKAVAKMLENSNRIRSLDLGHCFLNDIGLKKIGSGIEKNVGTLERLILRDNPISGFGANLILKAMATKEKLRHVDFSLCPVDMVFVTAASKTAAERPEMYIDHTGDMPTQALLPKYDIDFEAIAVKKAKAEAAKKAEKKIK